MWQPYISFLQGAKLDGAECTLIMDISKSWKVFNQYMSILVSILSCFVSIEQQPYCVDLQYIEFGYLYQKPQRIQKTTINM